MSNLRHAFRPFVAPGALLCLLASGAALLAMSRSTATNAAPQAGGVRVVYVPAEAKRVPVGGPAIAVAQPQLESTEWTVVVDGPTLARRVEAAARVMSADGYAIVSVTPILRGEALTQERQGAATQVGVGGVGSIIGGYGTGWGAGYSVTEGIMIVGERR